MLDTCNEIHEVISLSDEVDGRIGGTEQIVGALSNADGVTGRIYSDGGAVGAIAPSEEMYAEMESEGHLVGDLVGESVMQGEVVIGNCIEAPPYKGDYVITPKVDAQTMQTRARYMLDDVTVKAIPYYETANTYGTTIYIGE